METRGAYMLFYQFLFIFLHSIIFGFLFSHVLGIFYLRSLILYQLRRFNKTIMLLFSIWWRPLCFYCRMYRFIRSRVHVAIPSPTETTRLISFMWCMSPWHIQLIIFFRGTRVNFFLLFRLSSFELSTPQLPSHCSIAHISFTLFFLYFPHCSTMINHYKNPPPHPIPYLLFALPPSHAPTTGHPIHHLSQLRHFQRERGHHGDPKIHHCRTSISVLVSNMHPLHTVLVVDAIPHLFWGLSYWGKGQVFGLWEELNAMRRIEEINVWFQIAWSTTPNLPSVSTIVAHGHSYRNLTILIRFAIHS